LLGLRVVVILYEALAGVRRWLLQELPAGGLTSLARMTLLDASQAFSSPSFAFEFLQGLREIFPRRVAPAPMPHVQDEHLLAAHREQDSEPTKEQLAHLGFRDVLVFGSQPTSRGMFLEPGESDE